ncbi:MAG: DNA repair protein RecN [Candidatus Cryptobacteroides sp.]
MLRRLHIKNYVLIDSLDIEFPDGLVIITGQTGAGKSIIIGALSMILGAKADASVIGEGCDTCVAEAEFATDPLDGPLQELFDANDIEWDEGRIIIRRVVGKTGRARAFVNDSPTSLHVLSALSSRLLDVHSQHQTLMLSDKKYQLTALDLFASSAELRTRCSSLWASLQDKKSTLSALEAEIASLESEREYNQAIFDRLDNAALRDGEMEELEAEQKQLAYAEEIKENLFGSENLIAPSDDESSPSVDAVLREVERRLEKVARFIPEAEAVRDRVVSARVEMDDILSEIEKMESRIEVSPERLQEVEDRMSMLYGLMQKHSVRTVAELISLRDSLSEKLFDSTALLSRREGLQKEIADLSAEYNLTAALLHEQRVKASVPMAKEIQDTLRGLEMQNAVFAVEVTPAPASATGCDCVSFLFSSTGKVPVDVAKCASGGELSRIMLSLKAMMARFTSMPTMIFDEIDTGVSGSVADKMGTLICSMGADMQVFAITHLPQVAAKGSAHYLVSKDIAPSGRTVTTIKKLSREERVLELARMLSGSHLTEAAMANAESLLG